MLTGDDTVEVFSDLHDARDRLVCLGEHLIVV